MWYGIRTVLLYKKTKLFVPIFWFRQKPHKKVPDFFDMSLKIVSTINQNNVINHLQSVHGTHWYGYYNVGHHGSSLYRGMILPSYLLSFNLLNLRQTFNYNKIHFKHYLNTYISFHYNFTFHFKSINTLNTQFR